LAFEIAPFGHINERMSRIRAIGHGNSTPLSWMEALHIAADAVPAAPRLPQSFYEDPDLGTMVRIRADDYGQDPVEGKLIFLDANEVAISREDPKIGEVVVDFPARVRFAALAERNTIMWVDAAGVDPAAGRRHTGQGYDNIVPYLFS